MIPFFSDAMLERIARAVWEDAVDRNELGTYPDWKWERHKQEYRRKAHIVGEALTKP